MRYGTRLVVLCGALAWCSGMLLVQMNRGVLAHGRVAGVATTNLKAAAPTKGGSPTDAFAPGNIRPVDDGDGDGGGPVRGPLRVMVATTTPPSATLPDGTRFNPMLSVQFRSLSGLPTNLTSIALTEGFAMFTSNSTSTLPSSTVLGGVSVWEGSHRHGAVALLAGTQRRATVSLAADPIVIQPFGSKVITFAGDLPANTPVRDSDYGVRLGLAAAADVAATGTSGIAGPFPLNGNLFSWVDGSSSVGMPLVQGVAVGGYSTQPTASTTPNLLVGVSTSTALFRFNLADLNNVEPMVVRQVVLRLEGTAQDSDFANWSLVPGNIGAPFATATAAVNGVVTFDLPQPFINLPGTNVTFQVYAQPIGGAGHWMRARLQFPEDITVTGGMSGYTLQPQAAGWPTLSPFGYWVIGSEAPHLLIQPVADTTTVSRIILASSIQQNVHILSFTSTDFGRPLQIERLTLQLEGPLGGASNHSGAYAVNAVRLYRNGSQVGLASLTSSNATTTNVLFNFSPPQQISGTSSAQMLVRVDTLSSWTGLDATQFQLRVKSDSASDTIVRDIATGLVLPLSNVYIPPTGTYSSWFLNHEAAPTLIALPVTSAHIRGTTDEIARFEVRNYGQVPLQLDSLSFLEAATDLQMSSSSSSTVDRVNDFNLYDDSGNAIAHPDVWRQLSATTSTSTLRFSSAGSINAGWEANRYIPAMSSSTYGTRVYSLRANTTNIVAVGGNHLRLLTSQIVGQRGHVDGNSQGELNWADGNVGYGYTPAGYSTPRTGFTASDSYPVVAPTISYN